MPKVSVIIPVYNVEKYLRECLDSVCAQTLKDIEIICVDDGSTDSSPAILDEYAAKDPRFTIIKCEHSNAGACRNAGLDIAKGEYLSFLDSDDVFAPRMLEVMHAAIESTSVDVALCQYKEFLDGETPVFLHEKIKEIAFETYQSPGENVNIFISRWGAIPWNKMCRKSFILNQGIRYQEIRSGNDIRFNFAALSLAKAVVFISANLIAYRKHATSLQATKQEKIICGMEAYKSYKEEMEKLCVFPKNRFLLKNFKRTVVLSFLWELDSAISLDAYMTLHEYFKEHYVDYGIEALTLEDFKDNPSAFLRIKRINEGCSPAESLRYRESLLVKELTDLCRNRIPCTTIDYRVGKCVLFIPRLLKACCRFCFHQLFSGLRNGHKMGRMVFKGETTVVFQP